MRYRPRSRSLEVMQGERRQRTIIPAASAGASSSAGSNSMAPGSFRQRHGARGLLHRPRACGGAVANAAGDALHDSAESEEVVGKIPVEIRDAAAAGLVAVDRNDFVLGRNAEARDVHPAE